MSLLDRVKTQAEQTAAKAREGVQEVQVKRELTQAYADLGKAAFSLVEKGEISHTELAAPTSRIKELNAKLTAESQADTTNI
jgi:hypothetical protein